MAHNSPFYSLFLEDEAASLRFGEDFSPVLRPNDCVLLEGTLGMGKTTIARAIIRSFLGDDEAEVPSPTFTLANIYDKGRTPLTHYDLYRLSDPEELEEIGFAESLDAAIVLLEWPERAMQDMPSDALQIKISEKDGGRLLEFFGPQRWQNRLRRTLLIRTFLNDNKWQDARRRFLQGDASPRAYELVTHKNGTEAVLMDSPAIEDGPIVKDGKRYSELAHLAEDVRPFLAIGEALRAADLPAPEMYAYDMEQGFLLMQDFGQETVIANDAPHPERYQVAVDILAKMHGQEWPSAVSLPDGSEYQLPTFDQSVFDIEISLLADWYAPKVAEITFSEKAWAEYLVIWQGLFELVSTGEKSWFLRDYHSPNLMWRADQTGLEQIGLIDYQDALIGPSAYDVASLCQDARYTVPESMELMLKSRYIEARAAQQKPFDEDDFERDYAIIAAERGTRLLGLWPRLKYRDGKPHYMNHMPRTKDYLRRALKHPALVDLKHWYADNLGL